MRKPSSPAEAPEAVPLLTLLLVPLIPDVLGPNVIDREDGLELPQGSTDVTFEDGHTAACESLVMQKMADGVPVLLTGVRVVR